MTRASARLVCLATGPWLALGCATPEPAGRLAYYPPPPSAPHVVQLMSFNSLDDLVPRPRSFVELVRGGSVRPSVITPAGVAYRDGHLYVCDTGLNVVHDWDLSNGDAQRIGESGDAPLSKPVAVAVDERGTIFVADTGRAEVVAFDAAGEPAGRYRGPGEEGYRPVAVAAGGGRLYVADLVAHHIDVFATGDGSCVSRVGGAGSGPGTFYFPTGVALMPAGGLAVADMMNGRVQVFDDRQRVTAAMGRPGDRYGDMGKPRHLAAGPDGVLFVADAELRCVHLFNSNGELLMVVGGTDEAADDMPMPVGVAVADRLPDRLASLVPAEFQAKYFLFTTDTIGKRRARLFAVGGPR